MSQIAILEGYRVPRRHRRRRRRRYGDLGRYRRSHRRRRRYGEFGRHARRGGSQRARFRKAAKTCSRVVRKRGGSFRACMRRHLKKGR